jgi:hypothetical protein
MLEQLNTAGYDLYQVFDNRWVIDLKDGNAFHGTLKEVYNYMVNKINFFPDEIVRAIDCMYDVDNIRVANAAHFGMNKTFIYQFNKELNLEKVS